MNPDRLDLPGSGTALHRLAAAPCTIVAAVDRPDTDHGVALLREAGFAHDRIEVLFVEEIARLEGRLGGTGLHRFLVRLRLVPGDELDELESARRALMSGRALIQVLVHGDEEQRRAQATFSRHSGCGCGCGRVDEGAYPPPPRVIGQWMIASHEAL
ncbi:MAG: hypothetical protein WBA63_14720 [Thermomicrobiales bacterium]